MAELWIPTLLAKKESVIFLPSCSDFCFSSSLILYLIKIRLPKNIQNCLEGNIVVAETDCRFFVTDKYFLSYNFGSQAEEPHVFRNSRLMLPVSAMNSARNYWGLPNCSINNRLSWRNQQWIVTIGGVGIAHHYQGIADVFNRYFNHKKLNCRSLLSIHRNCPSCVHKS